MGVGSETGGREGGGWLRVGMVEGLGCGKRAQWRKGELVVFQDWGHGWVELTELLGNSTLLDEPEAQGAEGVALGGLGQLEGIKVPVVGSS